MPVKIVVLSAMRLAVTQQPDAPSLMIVWARLNVDERAKRDTSTRIAQVRLQVTISTIASESIVAARAPIIP